MMNFLKPFFCLFLFSGLLLLSCSKDDDGDGGGNNNDPTNPNLENHFSCKINGEEWTANGVDQPTVTRLGNADAPLNQLDFFGKEDGGLQITITVVDYENGGQGECLTENSYYGTAHANTNNNYSTTVGGTTYTNYARFTISGTSIAHDGVLEVTDCGDGKISGTFEFVVTDLLGEVTHTVTEGAFTNVEYDFFE